MKCKKCGNEIAKGKVYCDSCGAEVQIVPDYNAFDEAISNGVKPEELKESEELSEEVNNNPEVEDEVEKTPVDKKKKALFIVGGIILVVALIFIVSLFVTSYQNNRSFSYQYDRAQQYLKNHRTDKALESVNKALKIDKDNEEALLLLADIQKEMGEDEDAIDTLLSVVDLYPDHKDAYSKLITIYSGKGDFDAIAKLSKGVKDEQVKSLFIGYVPTTPTFSEKAGKYDDEISLEITGDSSSLIYYTVDGSDPREKGIAYTEELCVEEGTTLVKAVSTNEFGLYSDVVEAKYEVELAVPDKPEVSLQSGTYDIAKTVSVKVPKGCSAYYTWDGSNPTKASKKYNGPFVIPEGNNVFSVIVVNGNGRSSDVARFNYIYYSDEESSQESEGAQ
ncbi:MAG: chitobiase/beta-hexosaminidase C-terminal domain-containing protein [Lachnospiraceae bacterium]|nr:chitobiase/beta-hexosaminidase C-terminal domain-containing protein [Lachnospiraceae bacterium]